MKKENEARQAKFNALSEAVTRMKTDLYQVQCDLDEVQQYLRRDCLEFVGIPSQKNDNPNKIVKEVCSSMGIELKQEEFSIVHRLPDSKNTKDRIIAKFVRRDVKEQVYRSRKKLQGKSVKSLPSFKDAQPPKSAKIYINESLTGYRKKLFNRVYNYKKTNDYKYIWTQNGKIFLKEDDDSEVFSFTTVENFIDFENDY